MLTQFRIVKLLIAASIVVYCDSSTYEEMQMISQKLLAEAKEYKLARCFAPSRLKCGGITHPHPDFELGKWSYDASSKTCTPLYMPREQQNFCPDYMVLPQTKKECEDLCGEPCIVTYGNKKTEPGICMRECHIPIPEDVPQPCPPNHTRCCPRNYEFPIMTPPSTEQPMSTFNVNAIIINMNQHHGNNSNATTDSPAP